MTCIVDLTGQEEWRYVIRHGNLGRFLFSQNFRLKIPETFRMKITVKAFFNLGEERRFLFQICSLVGRSKSGKQNGNGNFVQMER